MNQRVSAEQEHHSAPLPLQISHPGGSCVIGKFGMYMQTFTPPETLLNKPPSVIHNGAQKELLVQVGMFVWKVLHKPCIPNQISTVAGDVKEKLKQAETNCLKPISSQHSFVSEIKEMGLWVA